jgi:type VI secretion system secreted protein VgrG
MAIIRTGNKADLSIKIGSLPVDRLRVIQFTGNEAISELFHYSFDLASVDGEIKFSDILGQPAYFVINGPSEKRHLHGIVSRFEQRGKGIKYTRYHAEVTPEIWFLSCRFNSRIFQNQTVPDIIKKVLTDGGISKDLFRFALKGEFKPKDYIVQYRESDFTFISRLMEQYGIYYFFEQTEKDHVMVIANHSEAHVDIPKSTIGINAPSGKEDEDKDYVSEFHMNRGIQPEKMNVNYSDYKKNLVSLESAVVRDNDEDRKSFDKLEIYDYLGQDFLPETAETFGAFHLEGFQTIRKKGGGMSNCRRLMPGFRFKLEKHDRSSFNREYLITQVTHSGSEPQSLEGEGGGQTRGHYFNHFECIPSDTSFRPLPLTAKPVIQGPQTAVVVGPQGEEIYTDEFGRVKVQFRWDHEGKTNENSSCWVRVGQLWAGDSWGALFLPRVGQEVIIQFLNGDPDHPIVVGSVYNGINRPPYKLPDEMTKSTIKTNSSKNGGGSNEIRFEDKKGDEQIFIQGEKNFDLRVKHDTFEWVGNDRHLIVKKDQIENVENDRHEIIGADHVEQIGKDRHITIKGKEAIEIAGSRSVTVKGDVIDVFKESHSEQVADVYYLKGNDVIIEGMSSITLMVGGSSIAIDASGITIKSPATMEIKGAQVTVDADATLDLNSNAATNVKSSGMTAVKGSMVMIN